MIASVYLVLFASIGAVLGENENEAKIRFYHGSMGNYTELPLHKVQDIFSFSWYNPNWTTTMFVHGFTGHPDGPAITSVINALLEEGNTNVALVNWDRQAAVIHTVISTSYLNWAVPNAIRLGSDFADALLGLSTAGLDLNKTHLVGHSLGAQILGIAGNKMAEKGIQLPWITGLDPAGVLFDSKLPYERLNSNSAKFVAVIHSDPSKYGSKRSLGTVDFWPNYRNIGQVIQPGCDGKSYPRFSKEDLCNHNKCWQYFIDAMKYPGTLIGSYANNFRTWKNYSKPQRLAVVLELGKYYEHFVPGNYYFVTAALAPYGLGENGL